MFGETGSWNKFILQGYSNRHILKKLQSTFESSNLGCTLDVLCIPPLIFYLIWTILPYYDRVDAAGFWWYIETCFWRPFLTIYAQVANNPIFVGTLTWGHFMFGTSMMFREKVFNVIYVELPLNQTDAF